MESRNPDPDNGAEISSLTPTKTSSNSAPNAMDSTGVATTLPNEELGDATEHLASENPDAHVEESHDLVSGTVPIHTRLPGNFHNSNPEALLHDSKPSQPMERDSDFGLNEWATQNGVHLNGVEVVDFPGNLGKGVKATREVSADSEDRVLIQVPSSMVLNLEYISNQAGEDETLADILNACYPWTATPRGAIVVFLLVQITKADPELQDSPSLGPKNPWTSYISHFLQNNPSPPTQWPPSQRSALFATSLERLAQRKVDLLSAEYERLLANCSSIPWCCTHWDRRLTFQDFLFVETLYRSRAMELEGLGNCLVPVMDMANHDDESNYVCSYTYNHQTGYAEMTVEFGRYITMGPHGTEVTINYGWDKTPADMLLSYGFIDSNQPPAGVDLFIPESFPVIDELTMLQQQILGLPPVCHVRAKAHGRFTFESHLLWAAVLGVEDGLRAGFPSKDDNREGRDDKNKSSNNGEDEQEKEGEEEEEEDSAPSLFFNDTPIFDATSLLAAINTSPIADALHLRFLSVVRDFLLFTLSQRSEAILRGTRPDGISDENWATCEMLRGQETGIIREAADWVEERIRFNDEYFQSRQPDKMYLSDENDDDNGQEGNSDAESVDTDQQDDAQSSSKSSSNMPRLLKKSADGASQASQPSRTSHASYQSARSTVSWEPYRPGINSGTASWKSVRSSDSRPSQQQQQQLPENAVDDDNGTIRVAKGNAIEGQEPDSSSGGLAPRIQRMRFTDEDRQRAQARVREAHFSGQQLAG